MTTGINIGRKGRFDPIEKYLPPTLIIHYYSAMKNKIIKTSSLNEDIINYFCMDGNKQFFFLCLLCYKKINFITAFSEALIHPLTKKHQRKVNNALCVGVLLVSSHKFVMCREEDLKSGKIFNDMNILSRKNKLTMKYKNNYSMFTNYSIFTFDISSKSMNKIECDIVNFMVGKCKPLQFLMSCLLCNKKRGNVNQAFDHFGSKKHLKKLKEGKCAIIFISKLNIFVASIYPFMDHLNSYLEEISEEKVSEGIIPSISECHSIIRKQAFKNKGFQCTHDKTVLSSFMNISRSSFIDLIRRDTCEMKQNYKNRQIIFQHLTKDILSLMSTKFPNLSVTFYGSRLSGLAKNESDFDIFLNLGNHYLHEVEDLLATENDLFQLIVCISDSSVPIIRAKHKATGYICEFNLNNSAHHVSTSKTIKILIDLDERVLWFLAAVRYWSIATEIRGTNMFSSHAITWLGLFYLMQPELQIIPNVSFIVDQCGDLASLGDEGCILDWKPKINKDKTWLELLEGFFNYYYLMKFSENQLFPSSGKVVHREPGMTNGPAMHMQDPFDKERNILFNATKEKSAKLIAACYFSLHLPWRLDE